MIVHQRGIIICKRATPIETERIFQTLGRSEAISKVLNSGAGMESFHLEGSFGFGRGGASIDLILPTRQTLIASDQTRASCKREVRPDPGAEDGQPVSKSDEEEDVNGDPC